MNSHHHVGRTAVQVVDERSCVVGMITRKELLPDRLKERLQASASAAAVGATSRGSTPPDTPTAHRGERSALLASP